MSYTEHFSPVQIESPESIGTLGFSYSDRQVLVKQVEESVQDLKARWRLESIPGPGFMLIDCDSELSADFVRRIVTQQPHRVEQLIFVVSSAQRLLEFGLTAKHHCLVIAKPISAHSLTYSLNALIERKGSKRSEQTGVNLATLNLREVSSASVEPLSARSDSHPKEPAETKIQLDDNHFYRLSSFPSVRILGLHPSYVRLASILLNRSLLISELGKFTRLSEGLIQEFLRACGQHDLLLVEPRRTLRPETMESKAKVDPIELVDFDFEESDQVVLLDTPTVEAYAAVEFNDRRAVHRPEQLLDSARVRIELAELQRKPKGFLGLLRERLGFL